MTRFVSLLRPATLFIAAALPTAPAIAADAVAAGNALPSHYRSAFEGYRAYVEAPLAGWREVNDEVAQVGGHIGILRAPQAEAKSASQGPGQAPVRGAPTAPGHKTHAH